MSLDEALGSISGVLAEAGRIGAVAGCGRWHVLFQGRPRPLLVPPGDYRLQKEWVSHFIGSRLRTAFAIASLKLNALLPGINLLPELRSPAEMDTAAGSAASPGPLAAIQIGTSGPYQKASALLISENGVGLALAKVALVSSADTMVATEAAWLRLVGNEDGLAGEVPQLLAEGTLANGRRYLVTSLAPSTLATTVFTPAHAQFLARLGRSRMEVLQFEASPCCEILERTLADMAPVLMREERTKLRDALSDCRTRLSGFSGPFVLSQGDFAWWNIRVRARGIFVFDWEYARLGANPLADLFHFHMIQRAAAGRSIGGWFLTKVIWRAERFARQHYPEAGWPASRISALVLAYLLDVLFQYCRACGKIDHEENVMRGYWSLMERRATWMAA